MGLSGTAAPASGKTLHFREEPCLREGGPGEFRPVVLLAEDDEQVRRLLSNVLRSAGYRVLAAGDGAAALETSRSVRGRIHVLLTDLDMPERDGMELASILERERPDTKVLIMSGEATDGAAARSKWELLQKPFPFTMLFDKLAALIGGQEHD